MKTIFLLIGILFCNLRVIACENSEIHNFSEDQILEALQKRIELLDPDVSDYYSEKEKQIVAKFLDENAVLFNTLSDRLPFHYIKLAELNKNPNITPNIALHAREAYLKYYHQYSEEEKIILDQAMLRFRERGYFRGEDELSTPRRSAVSKNSTPILRNSHFDQYYAVIVGVIVLGIVFLCLIFRKFK